MKITINELLNGLILFVLYIFLFCKTKKFVNHDLHVINS